VVLYARRCSLTIWNFCSDAHIQAIYFLFFVSLSLNVAFAWKISAV
jgi:hypothetical protein